VFLPPANNSFTGSLPTELGALSELEYLQMCKCNEQVEVRNLRVSHFVLLPPVENSFKGSLPTELGALTNLQYLQMCKCNVQVEVMNRRIHILRSFHQLIIH
jgi:hypothetical protein